MKAQIKPCDTVGNTFQVVKAGRFGKLTKVAIGLTKFEAECLKRKLEVFGKI